MIPNSRKPNKYDAVRAAALKAVTLIENKAQTDTAVREVTSGLGFKPLDMRFLLQLVNGTTKMRRRLDHEIKFYLARPSVALPKPLRNILRLGFYQLLFTDRVPDAAAVSESVNLARKFTDPSQAKLVNAVMRCKLREPDRVIFASAEDDPVKHLADFHSYPDYFVKYCIDEFGLESSKRLLEHYNRSPVSTYRVNYLKAKPEEISAFLNDNGIVHEPGKYLPEFLRLKKSGLPFAEELIQSGKLFVQDESSGLPVRLLNPRPGEKIVDLAAAPGGKSTYAAIRMRNKGRVTSVDKSKPRLQLVVENAERLGIKIISPVMSDLVKFEGGEFDRVLLDPPCSGWGTAKKHSDLRWAKSERDIDNLVKVQSMMLDHASRLVKPGGILVYSTCTIMRAENDQIIEDFLLRNNQFRVDPADRLVAGELVNKRGFVKTYPDFDNLDGSFCARLSKNISV